MVIFWFMAATVWLGLGVLKLVVWTKSNLDDETMPFFLWFCIVCMYLCLVIGELKITQEVLEEKPVPIVTQEELLELMSEHGSQGLVSLEVEAAARRAEANNE